MIFKRTEAPLPPAKLIPETTTLESSTQATTGILLGQSTLRASRAEHDGATRRAEHDRARW